MSLNASTIETPRSAAWLGGLGALPFVALGGAMPLLSGPRGALAAHALVVYGAIILSFLGGVHWGLAIADFGGSKREGLPIRLVISVIPSLAGWVAVLMTARIGLFVLAASVAAMLLIDLRATRLGEAPVWYPRLRIPLTIVVVAALLFAALA